jgi:acyl-CoA thioesterase-1
MVSGNVRNRIGQLLVIVAACLLPGNFAAAAPTILVVGDSLSAAYGLPQDAGWVSLLKSRLTEKKFPHQVANASISGETTAGGLRRVDTLLQQHQPGIVILELGANDGLRGLSVQQTRANLDQMIVSSKRHKAAVLLIGMRLPPNYGPAYAEPFRALFADLARQHKIRSVPFLLERIAGKREYFQNDGLHPTAEAQPILLDTVWPALQPMLKN